MTIKTQNSGICQILVVHLDKGARHDDYAAIACLTWYAGLRIHECFRIDTAIAQQALRENVITIKGKGGKIHTVPINESISVA